MQIRPVEIMAAAAARELRDGETVLTAAGPPLAVCLLARATHAPRLTILTENGVANMRPRDTFAGLSDSRMGYRATCWSGTLDVLGMTLHRGLVDAGMLSPFEADRYGNIDAIAGSSAAANDVASLAKRVILVMRHEKHKFPMTVAHLTGPGFPVGRERTGFALRGGGPHRIVTDKCVMGFDPETRMARLLSLHPGVTMADAMDNTGFALNALDELPETPLPPLEVIRLLRQKIDPNNVYLG